MKKVVPTHYFLLSIFIYLESYSNIKKSAGISENEKILKEVYSNACLMGVSVNDDMVTGNRSQP